MLNSSWYFQAAPSFIEELASNVNAVRAQKFCPINTVKAYEFRQSQLVKSSEDFLLVLSPEGICHGLSIMHAILHKQDPNFRVNKFIEIISQKGEGANHEQRNEFLNNIIVAQYSGIKDTTNIEFDKNKGLEEMIPAPLKGEKYLLFGLQTELNGGHVISVWQDLSGWNIFDSNRGEILGLTSAEVTYCLNEIAISYLPDFLFNSFYLMKFEGAKESLYDINPGQPSISKLIVAISYKNLEAVKFFVSKGADVNLCDNLMSASPLMWAAADAVEPKIVDFLLSNGADINATDKKGFNALFMAIIDATPDTTAQVLEVIGILIKRGINVNAFAQSGITPLVSAIYAGTHEIENFLLSNGADINAIAKDGRTALMNIIDLAEPDATNETLNIVELMMNRGVNANIIDEGGMTALTIAAIKLNAAVIDYLIEYGVDVSQLYKNEGLLSWVFSQADPYTTNTLLQHYEANILAPQSTELTTEVTPIDRTKNGLG